MTYCSSCISPLDGRFRYCPWCGAVQRRKIVEFFHGRSVTEDEPPRALRVSRYVEVEPERRHVRFSVWNESGDVQAAVSLDDEEAERVAKFLLDTAPREPAPARRGVRDRLRHRR